MSVFTSLRQRNFRLYWFGQIISRTGSGMQSIGQVWLVLKLTGSPWQLGLVGALQALPVLLFALFGGILADRWPKRRVLFWTQVAAMLQAFVLWLLIVGGVLQLWHLYVLAMLLGLTNSLSRPAGRAFVREMVGREDLANAVALTSSLGTLAGIVGPGLGGMLIAASGVSRLFLLNALSFLPVIICLACIRSGDLFLSTKQAERTEKPQTTWQSLREGIVYVRQTPAVLLLILVVGLVLFAGSNFNVLLPLFATEILHTGSVGFGFLSAASSIGALVSALWLARSRQKPSIRSVLIFILVFVVLEIAFAFSRISALSLVLIAGVGFAETAFAARAATVLQTIPPDHLSGRVMSVQVLFFDGSLPPGYLLMGWLAGLYGPVAALVTGAVLCLLTLGAGCLSYASAERDLPKTVSHSLSNE